MLRHFISLSCLTMIAACADGRPTGVAAPEQPSLVQNAVDTSALPDLIVDSKATQNNWVTRVEDFPADFCSVQEGGIDGTHKVIPRP